MHRRKMKLSLVRTLVPTLMMPVVKLNLILRGHQWKRAPLANKKTSVTKTSFFFCSL